MMITKVNNVLVKNDTTVNKEQSIAVITATKPLQLFYSITLLLKYTAFKIIKFSKKTIIQIRMIV